MINSTGYLVSIKKTFKKKLAFLTMLFLIVLSSFQASAHTWEIRVNQNQDGSLTWYVQSYHSITESSCISQAYLSGLKINGVQYPIEAVFSGNIATLSNTVFGVNTSCGTNRSIYGIIHTPYIAGTLNVQPYSNVACWSNCNISANGSFTPPPPPVCTSCPVTGFSNTVAATGNNNGTPCDRTDDYTTATIKVNTLACASITGNKQFRVIYDPSGANVSYGPFTFATGVETNVTINLPYGASNSTQVKVIVDDFPCSVQHSLVIPGGQYLGERETVPPTIICPSPVATTTNSGCTATGVNLGTPTTSDNCGGVTVTNNAPASYPLGTTTVTWKATDGSGNTATCTQTVTVTDNINPTITCPANVSATTNSGCTATGVNLGTPATSDNCTVASISNDHPSTTYPVGTTTVIWTVKDGSGNTATCTQTVTVTDNINPTITCPANVATTTNTGCTATGVNLGTPTTGDNCTVASVTNDAPAAFPLGNTTVTWTVKDGAGNTASCTQTVTVTDNINPTITCPAAVAATTNSGCTATGVNLGTPTTADNCTVASVTNDAPAAFPLGTTTVTWTVTDGSGNTATCTQTVTVTDNINPTITCPANVAATTNTGCTATGVNLGTPVTADNCTVASVTNNHPSTTYPLGTTTVIWTVTDGSGNTATCSQTVTVTDNINPTITCPANVAATTNTGCTATGVNLGTPTTADNCTVASVTNDHPSTTYPLGTTTVKWTVTDGSGNTATCNQTVTVTDNINPTITCPAPVAATTNTGCTATGVNLGKPTASDNCTVASVTNNHPSTTYPLGTTTVTWTVTDGSGNTATCTQTVTVTDNVNPTITCPPNRVVAPYRLNGTVVTYATPTASDNCSVASIVRIAGLASGSTFPIGVNTITYKVTDGSGNTATCSFTITVINPYCSNNGNNDKVYVCHNGNTICISVNALDTHLNGHAGDYLGACNPLTSSRVVTETSVAAKVTADNGDAESLKVVIAPNPSSTDFKLQVRSNTNEAATIRIINMSGTTMQTLNKVLKGQNVSVGSALKAGVYFAEVKQGNTKTIVKLVKL